jgi:major membrane immunogen (membrane-anchored lipoprotein)
MKKILGIGSMILLFSCGNSDQGGTVNDGTKDTTNQVMRPDTKSIDSNYHTTTPDSTKMRDREDIQKRDTSHS